MTTVQRTIRLSDLERDAGQPFPNQEERTHTALLMKDIRQHFAESWKDGEFEVGTRFTNGHLCVTISVPLALVDKCNDLVGHLYPDPSVPVIAVPMYDKLVSHVATLEDRPWWKWW